MNYNFSPCNIATLINTKFLVLRVMEVLREKSFVVYVDLYDQ